ncbi:MAG: hypothetical protein IKK57_03995 [Clostridia bacterium]|nr:hypothetical protein [Clostridia bacterium]
MKKQPRSSERLVLLVLNLVIAAFVIAIAWVNNRPITGPVGEAFTITVQDVRKGLEMHRIDAGMNLPFRIWRDEETDRLLEADMVGRTFRVLAEKYNPAKGSDYYRVIEMIALDGSFTYTWQDYAAGQAARLPGRMIVLFLFFVLYLAVICWGTGFFRFSRFSPVEHRIKEKYHD